jgi:hypothetical protein
MQLQEMVTRIRRTLGEPEANGYGTQPAGQGTWDNSQIIGYINEAAGILAHDWRKEKIGSIVATAGQTDFPLPDDALEDGLRTVSYLTNGTAYPMSYIDLDHYNRYATGQSPAYTGMQVTYNYTVFAGTIKIWPGASGADAIQPYYYRTPALLVAGADVSELPIRFHPALIFYAIAECQNAVEETNLETDARNKWQQLRQQFKQEMAKNQRDRGIRVRGRR